MSLREDPTVRRLTLSSAVVASSGALGAATAASPLAFLGISGLAGFAWLAAAPLYAALLLFLLGRSVTDAFAATPVIAGLNAGSLMGLFAIGLAVVRIGTLKRPRGLPLVLLLAVGLAFHTVVGGLLLGFRQPIFAEYVRALSIIAVGLIAANPRGAPSPSRAATVLMLAALLPALLVVAEGLMRWSEVINDGFRPRGTLSHPNAASLLFSIMLAVALWKWWYDGRRMRYLAYAGLMIVAVTVTQSMGGFFQLTGTLSALGLFQYRSMWARTVAALLVVSLMAFFVLDPFGVSRAGELTEQHLVTTSSADAQNSFEWRLQNWRLLIEEWKKEPLTGYGLGSTQDRIAPLRGASQEGLPHSTYIQLLVEGGVIGVITFGGAGAYLLFWLLRRSRSGPNAAFTAAVLAAVLGVAFHGLATHATLNTGPMYFLAALVGTALVLPGDAPEPPRSELPHGGSAAQDRRLQPRG